MKPLPMPPSLKTLTACTARLAVVALMLTGAAASAEPTVRIDEAWVRGTVAGQKASGVFMRLTPPTHVRLVSGRTSAADHVEIHEMAMDGDVMRMRQIDAIDLGAGRSTELKPGGLHLMLMSLKQSLDGTQPVPLTLVFEDDQGRRFEQSFDVPVRRLGGADASKSSGGASSHGEDSTMHPSHQHSSGAAHKRD